MLVLTRNIPLLSQEEHQVSPLAMLSPSGLEIFSSGTEPQVEIADQR